MQVNPPLGQMEAIHRETLRISWVFLMENMQPAELLDHLYQEGTITLDMYEQIRCERTTMDMNTELLFVLQRRGPHAFRQFLSTLEATGQAFIADHLRQICTSLGGTV